MSILCAIFGHQPPVYGKKGWWSPGEEYATRITKPYEDRTGRRHVEIYAECGRCEKEFMVCRAHLPREDVKP